MIIIGVDPGNQLSGVSVWSSSRLVRSLSYNPWKNHAFYPLPMDTAKVYVEVPQNGTHKSRGGVHWAAGMVVRNMMGPFNIRRLNVKKIYPRTWRAYLDLPLTGPKQVYIDAAREYAPDVEDDNEAEAILIGLYGAKKEGLL